MTDYISRKALLALPTETKYDWTECVDIEDIKNFPAADVEPVRHGRWEAYSHSCYCGIDQCGDPIFREKPVYYCSNPKCRRKTVVKENFCPSCGAKMDLMDLEDENDG